MERDGLKTCMNTNPQLTQVARLKSANFHSKLVLSERVRVRAMHASPKFKCRKINETEGI